MYVYIFIHTHSLRMLSGLDAVYIYTYACIHVNIPTRTCTDLLVDLDMNMLFTCRELEPHSRRD